MHHSRTCSWRIPSRAPSVEVMDLEDSRERSRSILRAGPRRRRVFRRVLRPGDAGPPPGQHDPRPGAVRSSISALRYFSTPSAILRSDDRTSRGRLLSQCLEGPTSSRMTMRGNRSCTLSSSVASRSSVSPPKLATCSAGTPATFSPVRHPIQLCVQIKLISFPTRQYRKSLAISKPVQDTKPCQNAEQRKANTKWFVDSCRTSLRPCDRSR